MMGITQRITSESVTQTYSSTDITRSDFIDILTVIGMHTQQAPNSFCFIFGTIFSSRTFHKRTRINTQVRQATYKGIRNNLENQCAKRRSIVYLTSNWL